MFLGNQWKMACTWTPVIHMRSPEAFWILVLDWPMLGCWFFKYFLSSTRIIISIQDYFTWNTDFYNSYVFVFVFMTSYLLQLTHLVEILKFSFWIVLFQLGVITQSSFGTQKRIILHPCRYQNLCLLKFPTLTWYSVSHTFTYFKSSLDYF